MISKEEQTTFRGLFDSYVSEYKRNLTGFYPCDVESKATLPEANMTTAFLISTRLRGPYKNALYWNELSVKNMRVQQDAEGSNMDGWLFDREKKHMFLIESKRLKYSADTNALINEHDGKETTLSSDIARAINVANSDVFPSRVWDPHAGRPFTSIGEKYNEYRTFGIALVSTWIEDGKLCKNDYEAAFAKYLKNEFEEKNLSCSLRDLGLPEVKTEDWILCAEDLSELFPVLEGKKWQYFILMAVWEINKQNRSCPAISHPTTPIRKKLVSCLQGIAPVTECGVRIDAIRDDAEYVYLKTTSIPVGNQRECRIWIPLNISENRLLVVVGSKQGANLTITGLPSGFIHDKKYGGNWKGDGWYKAIIDLPPADESWGSVKNALKDFLDSNPFQCLSVKKSR